MDGPGEIRPEDIDQKYTSRTGPFDMSQEQYNSVMGYLAKGSLLQNWCNNIKYMLLSYRY